ncbi:MAG: hypothetical protein LUD14_07960, partial [Clostridiales bacterium]|nr:hypothetical protein [Clostridiales bacterium]
IIEDLTFKLLQTFFHTPDKDIPLFRRCRGPQSRFIPNESLSFVPASAGQCSRLKAATFPVRKNENGLRIKGAYFIFVSHRLRKGITH